MDAFPPYPRPDIDPRDAEIARLKALIVDVVEKNMVLEARLAGNSQEMAEAMGREVRDSLLKKGTVP